jgi:hypothetical protein
MYTYFSVKKIISFILGKPATYQSGSKPILRVMCHRLKTGDRLSWYITKFMIEERKLLCGSAI